MNTLYSPEQKSQVEISAKLKEKHIKVVSEHESYIKVECPQCGHDSAFVPLQYGVLTSIICNRKSKCRFSQSLFSYQEKKLQNPKKIEKYFSAHGLDRRALILSGVLGEDNSICLSNKKKAYKQFKTRGTGWIAPKRDIWSKKDGDFYRVLHEYTICDSRLSDTVYVFEGDADFLKGFQDGLTCTAPIYGASTPPKHDNTLAMFNRFDNIVFVYDNDPAGRNGSSKCALILGKHFPKKNIFSIELPEEGMDFCDYRKDHSLEDFFSLTKKKYDVAQTEEEQKIKKQEKRRQAKINSLLEESDDLNGKNILYVIEGEENDWIITDDGIYKKYEIRYGDRGTGQHAIKRIAPQSVIISNIYENDSTGDYVAELEVDGKVLKKLFNLDVFSSYSKILSLSKSRIKISEHNKRDFVLFFYDYLNSIKEESKMTYKNEWCDGGFVLGNIKVTEDGERPVKFTGKNYIPEKKGDRDLLIRKLSYFKDDPQLGLMMSASAISPALELLDIENIVISSYGKSSSGKTFNVYLALLLWGNPSLLKRNWKSTLAGKEAIFEESGHLPCAFDESHQAETKEVIDTIYAFQNGEGKQRAVFHDGEVLSAKSKQFKGVFFSTGERSLESLEKKNGGIDARVIEMLRKPVREGIEESAAVDSMKSIIKRNYGFAGKEIIQYIIRNKEKLIAVQNDFHEKYFQIMAKKVYENKTGDINSGPMRKIDSFIGILVGRHILDELGIPVCSEEALVELMMSFFCAKKTKSIASKAVEYIESIAMVNEKKFYVNMDGERFFPESSSEVWGRLDISKSCGTTLYLYPSILRKILSDGGYGASDIELLKQSGYMICSKNTDTKVVKINKMPVRTYALKLNCYTEDMNEDNGSIEKGSWL
jgi:hypothetical protein